MNAELTYFQPDVKLMLSIYSNDIQTVTSLLTLCKIDPDTLFRVSSVFVPAVLYCIERNNFEMAEVFINNNCSVNRTDPNGQSCLHLAVRRQSYELTKKLIEKKAIINSPTFDNKNTPLHYACSLTSLEIVKLLVENNADVNYKNIDGVTPLMLACSFNRHEIVKYLLSTGKCDINLVDNKESSALIYATSNSTAQLSKELIELLIRNGADVNHTDKKGSSILNTIITSSSESNLTGYELVSLLIEYGCDIDLDNNKSKTRLLTPIHLSIFHGLDTLTELFIRSGCNLNCVNLNDEPVLLSLIRNNKFELVKLAIEAGCDLNFFKSKLENTFKLTISEMIRRINDLELKDYLIELFNSDYKLKSLKQLTRLSIRKYLGTQSDKLIKQFNIPIKLKSYLELRDY